MITRNYRSRI